MSNDMTVNESWPIYKAGQQQCIPIKAWFSIQVNYVGPPFGPHEAGR